MTAKLYKKGDRIRVIHIAEDGYGDVGWLGTVGRNESEHSRGQVFIDYDVSHENPKYPNIRVTCGWINRDFIIKHIDIEIYPKARPIPREFIFSHKVYHAETLWKELVG